MQQIVLPFIISLLIVSLAGCGLVPPGAQPTPTAAPSIPPSGYEPKPDDDKLQRDQVFLEPSNSTVVFKGHQPTQASVLMNGSLSDPCHQLRVVVTPADTSKRINLEVYSVFAPEKACITVIKPFNVTIPLGNYSGGHYSVYVNGEFVGEFDS